jgi:histidine triad (HIT) family protein
VAEGAGELVYLVRGCVFCSIIRGESAAAIVGRGACFVALLDKGPVFKGHVLVVPTEHHETLADLPPDAVGPFFSAVQRVARAVPAALGCAGTFVAMNNKVSQSVPHLHVHVVPRSKGDGLRGFFWPRQKYAGADEIEAYRARIAEVLGS